MFTALKRRYRSRRGVTLVEMLVVVALVVLMMVILVQIFQSALGAMSASRTTQELDVVLRSIDSMIRSDLNGVTAKMTPPNDPALKTGYFEYHEGAPADLQGEDTDDFLAFTTKAPEGQFFSGRQWLTQYVSPTSDLDNQAVQPTTITSQAAEVIYFLRNGNLYRRVFLVAPDRNSSIASAFSNPKYYNTQTRLFSFPASIFGTTVNVSWQGMNDISCRPNANPNVTYPVPIPNDLGDLTNRENRAFRPRFANDYSNGTLNDTGADGIPDDNNGDGVPDYYPTLYYNGSNGHSYKDANGFPIWSPNALTNEQVGWNPSLVNPRVAGAGSGKSYNVYGFPYIYPGMYSVPDGATVSGTTVTPPSPPYVNYGLRHGMLPGFSQVNNGNLINHSPIDLGDNLAVPLSPSQKQTWWGFPTWRETMTNYNITSGWGDPVVAVNATLLAYSQPLGLSPLPPQSTYDLHDSRFLPPLYVLGSVATPPLSGTTPTFSDGAGSTSFVANPTAPTHLWDDELILTNVRSFDVKAYDPDAPLYNVPASNILYSSAYQDLGYAAPICLAGWPTASAPNWQTSGSPVGFGHEGRMPPISNDFRLHPRRPTYIDSNGVHPYNIGDDNPGIIRMVHTFDTWSTAYTNAPDSDIFLNGYSVTGKSIYPSYPAPYPSALRGIQIQIRVTDPRNERTKVLTIRQDFTDKL